MGKLKGHTVYKIVGTELLPLRERQVHDPDEDTYLSLIKTLLKTGPMYFSYSIDLTNSFQRQQESDPSVPLWKRADDRFFWNRFVQTDLIDMRSGGGNRFGMRQSSGEQPAVDPFILPVMFGMMRIANATVKGTPLTFVLITRRSRHRAGTRYLSRGLDDEGHVSNFNETEQAVIMNDNASGSLGGYGQNGNMGGSAGKETQVLSYVQTRGSVPVFWAEINTLHYVPNLQIRGVESATHAARLHFDEQIRLYGENYLVNLVNQKGREKRVKDAYEQIVKVLLSTPKEGIEGDLISNEKTHVLESNKKRSLYDHLHYIYFDFHNETKGLKWHRAKLLMDQLEQPVLAGGYYRGVAMPGDPTGQRMEVRNQQNCVVRTNCMDCLDRTNVIQSMLGRFILSRMLIDLGMMREGESAEEDKEFEHLFRNIWADNADVVSKSYSGTGALKTDFTRTGNRTKQGAFQDFNSSATRYIKNNFLDGPRQDAFDLFLGNYLPNGDNVGSNLIFVDRRPIFIQAIPYILAASIFFVVVGSFTRRPVTAAVWPLRVLMILFLGITVACLQFMWTHGTLFVS